MKLAPRGEEVSVAYTQWALLHLLLITLVPFTTMLIGRYPTLAPAVWFYAGNTIAFALVTLHMVTLSEYRSSEQRMIEDRIRLGMLIAASFAAILISLAQPKWALLSLLLNSLDGSVR
ncbi:MAG: hypothetical protein K2X60_08270 [Xanthobacteraceae bacterium]|nr:hypothetical protein [Xanthobacteraceae bacterium]